MNYGMDSKIIVQVDGKVRIRQWCSEFCYVTLERIYECPYKVDCRRCNINKKVLFGKLVMKYAQEHNWFGTGKYTLEIK